MSDYQLKNDEVILFEGNVLLKDKKTKNKFTLTNNKMIFEKEKVYLKKI